MAEEARASVYSSKPLGHADVAAFLKAALVYTVEPNAGLSYIQPLLRKQHGWPFMPTSASARPRNHGVNRTPWS